MEVWLSRVHKNNPGKFFPPFTLQQSAKEMMRTFLNSSAALLLLAGFLGAVLTDEAQTEGSTTITNSSTTSTSVTTGPAGVQDANATASTKAAITTTSEGKQSHSGKGAEQDKEETDQSREDDKPGKRVVLCCWLNLIVFTT